MLPRVRLAHALVTLVGLVVLLYPVTFGASPEISCRGVQMRAGDTCAKADSSGVQTYEQRLRAANQAKPVIFGVGLLLVLFGGVLLAGESRQRHGRGSP